MATSRRESLRFTFAGGHDLIFEYCCDLCEEEGNVKEAVGYCSDCKTYLCSECFNTHLRPKPSRHHTLLDQKEMPKDQTNRDTGRPISTLKGGSDFLYDNYCDQCEGEGQQKEAVGYCSDCKAYLCSECFNTHLRPKPFRHHQLLDQHQIPTVQQQKRPTSTLKGGSDFIAEDCCDLCEGEGQQKEVVGYCSDCREYLCTDCFRHHTRPKPSRHHVLLDQHQMPARKKTRAHHVKDVRVRSRDESYIYNKPDITGCVVLPGDKLVLVDNNNANVKMVDLTRGDVVSRQKLSGGIWGITQVSSTQVAVTSPGEQTIYFVKVGDNLKTDRKVNVKGRCFGIARINDNLVVSYKKPVKVEIISMEGKVLQTVVTEDKGEQLFTSPWYIAVSKDQQTVYISDWDRDTVTSVDLAGRVQATYKDDKLELPRGLTVDTAGTVYVCGGISNNVLQLTADLTEERELLQDSDAVEYPRSICYCEATDRLYVGMVSDVVKVFQMK